MQAAGGDTASGGGQLEGIGGQIESSAGGTSSGAGGENPGGVGGIPFETGGAPASGGGPATGGASLSSGGGPSGGQPGSGGGNAAGGAPTSGPLFPAAGSSDTCPDPSLRLRFDSPPTLGNSGMVRVFDAVDDGSPVVSIDMSNGQTTDDVGGATFNIPRPAYVHENEAIFVLPASGLQLGHSYYVTMDSAVVEGPGEEVIEFTSPGDWTFTTRSVPPSDSSELRVAVDGTGDFCTLQGAIEGASGASTIAVAPGAYYGLVYFKNKNDLTIRGEDRASTLIAGVNNNNLNPSTRGRALFGVENVESLTIENVTIHNQTPQGGSQAEALALLSCDQCIVRNTTVKSLQDTLLWSGRVYAEDCLIEGNVDYIWGTGTAFFNRCEIKTVGRSGYNIQARNSASNYGYVFVDSKLTADPGITGDVFARIDVTQYPASHVAYIDCEVGSHISSTGWVITGGGNTSQIRFWEYQSRNPQGALIETSGRAAGSRQISESEAATMRDPALVFGGWDPSN
jgi:hypothetical protein